jgi:hypothetical protein
VKAHLSKGTVKESLMDADALSPDVQLDPDLGGVSRPVRLKGPDLPVPRVVPLEKYGPQRLDESRLPRLVPAAYHVDPASKRSDVDASAEDTYVFHREANEPDPLTHEATP